MASRTTLATLAGAAIAALAVLLAARRRSRAIEAIAASPAPAAPVSPPGGQPSTATVRSPKAGPLDDVSLARKVETELFRSPEIPRGNVTVDARGGVVTLRGQVDSQGMRDDLEQAARNVLGVHDVRNELQLLQATA
jgi:osmotically-inducible protein OsmY